MTDSLANIGDDVAPFALQFTPLAVIEYLRILSINAESFDRGGRKRRECHGRNFRSNKANGASKKRHLLWLYPGEAAIFR